MDKRFLLVNVMSLAILGAAGCHDMHNQKESEDEDEAGGEVKMQIDQVPQAVRDTLAHEAPGVNITSVDKEISKTGQIHYEADAVIDGKNREIVVNPDGKLVTNRIDTEEDEKKPEAGEKKEADEKKEKDEDDEKKEVTITADQLPAPVKATLDKETAGGTIGKLEKETSEDNTVYEANATIDGKNYKLKVGDNGLLLKKDLKMAEKHEEKDDDEKEEKGGKDKD